MSRAAAKRFRPVQEAEVPIGAEVLAIPVADADTRSVTRPIGNTPF